MRPRSYHDVPHVPLSPTGELSLHCIDERPAGVVGRSETLVFIHALGCDLHLWETVARSLAPAYRVIRYDLRGHGKSGTGATAGTIFEHAEDLERLFDGLDVEAATLIGISVGGLVALDAARRFPERVRRLVLCATGAKIGTTESWNERIEAVRSAGLEACADAILARWFTPAFLRQELATYCVCRDRLLRTPLGGYLASCAALRDADFRGKLSTIHVPTLVLSGEHDRATPPALGRELAAEIRGARFEVIAGAAHLPPLEQPAAMSAAIQTFLEETA